MVIAAKPILFFTKVVVLSRGWGPMLILCRILHARSRCHTQYHARASALHARAAAFVLCLLVAGWACSALQACCPCNNPRIHIFIDLMLRATHVDTRCWASIPFAGNGCPRSGSTTGNNEHAHAHWPLVCMTALVRGQVTSCSHQTWCQWCDCPRHWRALHTATSGINLVVRAAVWP